MPSRPEDTVTKEVLYPDELVGEGLELRSLNGTDTELLFYDAETDAAELPDGARYGWWVPATLIGTDAETWIASPRAFREAIVENRIGPGDPFRVVGVEKGPADHDPYEVEVEYPYEP